MNMFRTFLILTVAFCGAAEAASPVRLQIAALPGTLHQGDRARIDVQFLGREYQQVPNDTNRVVQFTWQALDSVATGNIIPAISVPAGVAHSADAWFECRTPGHFRIIATSAGLVEAQTLVVGVPRGTSRIENWLVPSVLAQSNPTVEIRPRQQVQGLVANGISRAQLTLVLGDIVRHGEHVSVELTTLAGSTIRYKDREGYSSLLIPIAEDNISSDNIYISTFAQDLAVTARVLVAGGTTDNLTIRFAPPRPFRVFLDSPNLTFQGHPVQADVGIEDQDHVPIRKLDTEHHIELSSPSDPNHTLISIDRPKVLLTPEKARFQVELRLNGYPPLGEIELQANDTDAQLSSSVATLRAENPARKVSISGPRQVRTTDRECSVLVSLLDEKGKNVTAKWDTLVSLHSDHLVPNDRTVTIPAGKSQVAITYKLPSSSRLATVIGSLDVPLSEQGAYGLAVVAAMYVLVLLACFGGILGALARQFFFEEVRFLKPRWVDGCLRPGLMGNTSFGALFGAIAFIAFELGLFRKFEIWASLSTSMGDASIQAGPAALAFLLGFVGGYGGPVLLDRVLRIQRKPEAAAAAATS